MIPHDGSNPSRPIAAAARLRRRAAEARELAGSTADPAFAAALQGFAVQVEATAERLEAGPGRPLIPDDLPSTDP